MFGTKIRSWMEAHLARSRTKRKEKPKQQQASQHPTQQETLAALDASAAFFVGTRHDFNEILPALALSPSHHYVKVHQQQLLHHHHHPDDVRRYRQPPPRQHPPPPPPPPHHQQVKSSDQSGQQQQQQQRTSAVNLSSPESAYSTGYSTDGTSPCATYAPEYYINVRPQQQQQQQQTRIDRTLVVRGRREDDARIDHHTGTYTVRNRLLDAETQQQQQQQQQQQHHPWRKPAPPTAGRPIATSPKIQNGGGYLVRNKPYSTSADCDTGIASSTGAGYPLQLFSPRRMPMVATTTTQVMPLVKSPRQRSRVRTNPWPSNATAATAGGGGGGGNRMMGATRPWSRQHMYNGGNADYCCRQESLSVGRSPVNRSDWRSLRQQQQLRQLQQRKGRTTSSSASSCSSRSRSRSCSVSSTASSSASNAHSNASSPSSSDDITLNEVMGKYDENYLYEKETDIVSDHEVIERQTTTTTTTGGGGRDTSCCSSANFSSDASASSLDLQHDSGGSSSRSTSRQRLRGLSGRRQRRRRHRRSVDSRDDEAEREHREEVELLQEVINRRFKKNNSEASAQTNRALLERLLMKNASSGGGGVSYEGRRAWSANPAPMRGLAASRSVGGTPICLRRTKTTTRASHLLSPQSRLVFERNHQVYPAESTSSLKNMSASELALIEADKEADLKYTQLIMEAERMLLNVQQQLEREESACSSRRGSSASVTADSSLSTATTTSRRLYPQQSSAPNKRVELIKNAELNIELALSKSRNSQPELSSGSIKDLLDHSSPKRLLQQQQKKIIEPAVSQAVASTQTTVNTPTPFHSLDVAPTTMVRRAPVGACADDDDDDVDEVSVVEESLLPSTSEHYACPQSEPVKRKVYEAQEPGRLLQRQQPPWLRNSDGDCASEQQLQTQLQSASAASSYSQLRKHMLIETLQGLKQSLEDQSAALKMSCLRPL